MPGPACRLRKSSSALHGPGGHEELIWRVLGPPIRLPTSHRLLALRTQVPSTTDAPVVAAARRRPLTPQL